MIGFYTKILKLSSQFSHFLSTREWNELIEDQNSYSANLFAELMKSIGRNKFSLAVVLFFSSRKLNTFHIHLFPKICHRNWLLHESSDRPSAIHIALDKERKNRYPISMHTHTRVYCIDRALFRIEMLMESKDRCGIMSKIDKILQQTWNMHTISMRWLDLLSAWTMDCCCMLSMPHHSIALSSEKIFPMASHRSDWFGQKYALQCSALIKPYFKYTYVQIIRQNMHSKQLYNKATKFMFSAYSF